MSIGSYIKFNQPFTCLIAGSTRSGKTELVKRILKNCEKLFNKKKLRVIYCYGIWNSEYKNLIKNVEIKYSDSLPEEAEIDNFSPDIIVIDDLMYELSKSPQLLNLFTKGSHHKNISVFFSHKTYFLIPQYGEP